jgi:hypothetical protein
MADSMHEIAIQADPRKVYDAWTTREGLSSWWTAQSRRARALDGRFRQEDARRVGGDEDRRSSLQANRRRHADALQPPELGEHRWCLRPVQHHLGGTHASFAGLLRRPPARTIVCLIEASLQRSETDAQPVRNRTRSRDGGRARSRRGSRWRLARSRRRGRSPAAGSRGGRGDAEDARLQLRPLGASQAANGSAGCTRPGESPAPDR